MPQLIATMPEKLRPSALDGVKKYPDALVQEWCDGQARKFIKDEDFTNKPSNFASYLRRRALALGFKSTSRLRGNHVLFQVIGKTDPK